MKQNSLISCLQSLINPQFAPTALKVALVVGSILFAINHGDALLQGKMTRSRWLSAALTYLVPYIVSIHAEQYPALRIRGLRSLRQYSGKNQQK